MLEFYQNATILPFYLKKKNQTVLPEQDIEEEVRNCGRQKLWE